MSAQINLLVLFIMLSTWLTGQPTQQIMSTASVGIVTINDLTNEDLLYAKTNQKEIFNAFRPIDQRLRSLGYFYPAATQVKDEANLRKFSFTDILTSDDPIEIKAFIEKIKMVGYKDLVDINISAIDHQCELTVNQNIDSEVLCRIFSELGFDGYYIYTNSQLMANN